MSKARITKTNLHSRGCTTTLDIDGQKFEADFSYDSDEHLDRSCQELAGILAGNFALSYLPLDEIEFTCSDDDEFRLMSTLAYQNRMSYAYFVRDNRRVSDYLFSTEPHYSWRRTEVDKIEAARDPDSILCFYSGGKDSTVSLKILDIAGYKVLPLVIFLKRDEYRHTSYDAPQSLKAAKRDFARASTNIDEIKPFFSEVTGYPLLEGTIRLYWVANALPLATGIGAKYVSLSGELTLTHVVNYAGKKIFNNLFDQVFPAGVLVNRVLEKKGLPSVLSAIQGLTVYGVQKVLKTHFPQEMAHQMTCNHPVWSEGRKQWRCCSQCEVCHSLYLIIKALGMSPEQVRLDEQMILSKRFALEELIGPAISQNEVEHCLAIDSTYAPNYEGTSHPEVGGIQFSPAYHNPTLEMTYENYLKCYSTLNDLLQDGIYLSKNGSNEKSNLEDAWNILSRYDYAFDGKETHVFRRA